jgi:hypothetical protein
MHDDASISSDSPISEDVILPILASIITMQRSSVELLCFPKKWRMEKSPAFRYFIGRYSNYLERRSIHCNCGDSFCARLCQDEDAKKPRAWVIQQPLDFPHVPRDLLMKKYGLQRFTCHKCFDLTCYDCAMGNCRSCYYVPRHCVRCEKDYCHECGVGNYNCSICEDFLCKGCEETGVSLIEIGKRRACDDCWNNLKTMDVADIKKQYEYVHGFEFRWWVYWFCLVALVTYQHPSLTQMKINILLNKQHCQWVFWSHWLRPRICFRLLWN